MTRADYCERLAADWRAADPGLDLALAIHPGAGHAFDHPLLLDALLVGDLTLPIGRALPNHCRFVETAPGEIRTPGGEAVTAASLKARLAACSGSSAWIGGDGEAAAAAQARLLAFLARALGG